MIQEILGLKRNNPVFAFERYHEIEAWLREQWAGLFQELLQRRSSQVQLTSLSTQVSQLRESNKTLKAYLESLMRHVSPGESETVIDAESKRLNELNKYRAIKDNGFVMFLGGAGLDLIQIGASLSEAKTVVSLFKTIRPHIDDPSMQSIEILDEILTRQPDYALRDINDARNRLGIAPLKWGVRQKKPDIATDILGEG
jgi:hypothetical protein